MIVQAVNCRQIENMLTWYQLLDGLDIFCSLQLESLPLIVKGVFCDDHQAHIEATTQLRKLLSIGTLAISLKQLYLNLNDTVLFFASDWYY